MKWFRELFKLGRWLFSSRPSDSVANGLTVEHMEYFPFSGYKYMMWCGKIITRKEKDLAISEMLHTDKGKVSYNHERIHVYQACFICKNSWIRYYWSYFVNWLKHNPLFYPSSACYYCNKYEIEAYANEVNQSYCNTYKGENLNGKYNIKHAKRLFKKMGCNIAEWNHYIKQL